jgi:clan AA aspartic protease
MTTGEVTNNQACVQVTFRLLGQPDLTMEFVVDTGFEGALTLPITTVKAMNLPFFQPLSANLANDDTVPVDTYVATIIWEGMELDVLVIATGKRPLLGTSLLRDKRLTVDFEENGVVQIRNL